MARKKFKPFHYPPIQEVYRDALSRAIKLGDGDVVRDLETGRITLDSGPVALQRDDFRSFHDRLADGDLDLLSLTSFARHYEAHPERFVRYE